MHQSNDLIESWPMSTELRLCAGGALGGFMYLWLLSPYVFCSDVSKNRQVQEAKINWRPRPYVGRSDLETKLASTNSKVACAIGGG